MAFITKSYQNLFGVRSYINAEKSEFYPFFDARFLVFKLKSCNVFPNLSSLANHRISSSSCKTYNTRKYIPIATVGTPFSIRDTVNGEQVTRSAT